MSVSIKSLASMICLSGEWYWWNSSDLCWVAPSTGRDSVGRACLFFSPSSCTRLTSNNSIWTHMRTETHSETQQCLSGSAALICAVSPWSTAPERRSAPPRWPLISQRLHDVWWASQLHLRSDPFPYWTSTVPDPVATIRPHWHPGRTGAPPGLTHTHTHTHTKTILF